MKYFHLIMVSLWRKPIRTSLTALSLVVAFLLFGLLEPLAQIFTATATAGPENLLVVAPRHSITDMLPIRYVNDIQQLDDVETVAHLTWFGGVYKDPANVFARWAVRSKEFLILRPELVLPDDQRQAFHTTRTGAIVGRQTAEKYHLKVGDKISLIADIWPNRDGAIWEFDLVGIYDGRDSTVATRALYFNFDYFDEYRAFGQGLISNVLFSVSENVDIDVIAERVDAQFLNSQMETRTVTEQAYLLSFAQQLGDVGLIARGILAAVFFTLALLAGNTMTQVVWERTAELGVMKAVGFSDVQIMLLVLSEALLLTVTSATIAFVMAAALINFSNLIFPQLPPLVVSPLVLLIGYGLAVTLGVISGLVPAVRAMRLTIVDALRA